MTNPTVYRSAALADQSALGPKMRALTERQQAFVDAIFTLGNDNYTEAARLAGYADNGGSSVRVAAYKMIHMEKILAAIKEEADRRLSAGAAMASNALLKMVADSAHRDHYKAVKDTLTMAGLGPKQQIEVNHTHEGRKELIAAIEQLAAILPPAAVRALLPPSAPMIDVTPAVVQEEDPDAILAELLK